MEDLRYPIRAVSKLTGISIDTLRAWERRYQVVNPHREGGRRLYTESDVDRFRLLNSAIERGHTISRLARMSDSELQHLLKEPIPSRANSKREAVGEPVLHQGAIDRVMAAVDSLDYSSAEREFALLGALLSPRELVFTVALPLMRQVGEAWHAGMLSVAQEHMISSVLRNLAGALIPVHRARSAQNKALFATPSNELHEIGILLSAVLAAGAGFDVVYLGPDLPADEIVAAARKTAPQVVVLGFVGATPSAAIDEIRRVADHLPVTIELWVGGTEESSLRNQVQQTRAVLLDDFEELEQRLAGLGG